MEQPWINQVQMKFAPTKSGAMQNNHETWDIMRMSCWKNIAQWLQKHLNQWIARQDCNLSSQCIKGTAPVPSAGTAAALVSFSASGAGLQWHHLAQSSICNNTKMWLWELQWQLSTRVVWLKGSHSKKEYCRQQISGIPKSWDKCDHLICTDFAFFSKDEDAQRLIGKPWYRFEIFWRKALGDRIDLKKSLPRNRWGYRDILFRCTVWSGGSPHFSSIVGAGSDGTALDQVQIKVAPNIRKNMRYHQMEQAKYDRK